MKILLSLLLIPILVLSGSEAFGQQVSLGVSPHEILKVTINEIGTAHVIHEINNTGTNLKPIQVDTISGNLTNLSVTDVSGNSVDYAKIQKSPLSIVLNPSQRNMTLIKYDLINVVTNNGGVWKWNYYEPQDTDFTAFHFPKGVDMIWANNRPVYLGNLGLGQHGNGFTLEYVINEPVTVQNVQVENKNFTIGIRSVAQPGNYAFDQSQKTYTFSVNKANVPITVIIPQVLLGGPYNVLLDGKPTLHQVFHNNGTYSWIGLKPEKDNGTILITGTTIGQEQQQNSTGQGQQAIIGQQQNSTGQVQQVFGGPMGDFSSSYNMIIPVLILSIIIAGVIGLIIIKRRRSKIISKS